MSREEEGVGKIGMEVMKKYVGGMNGELGEHMHFWGVVRA